MSYFLTRSSDFETINRFEKDAECGLMPRVMVDPERLSPQYVERLLFRTDLVAMVDGPVTRQSSNVAEAAVELVTRLAATVPTIALAITSLAGMMYF